MMRSPVDYTRENLAGIIIIILIVVIASVCMYSLWGR